MRIHSYSEVVCASFIKHHLHIEVAFGYIGVIVVIKHFKVRIKKHSIYHRFSIAPNFEHIVCSLGRRKPIHSIRIHMAASIRDCISICNIYRYCKIIIRNSLGLFLNRRIFFGFEFGCGGSGCVGHCCCCRVGGVSCCVSRRGGCVVSGIIASIFGCC